MSTAAEFTSQFDEEGYYRKVDGDVEGVFLTTGGGEYPGKLRFAGGLLIGAEMDGVGPWVYPDNSPLHGMKFLLQFPNEKALEIIVDRGRLVYQRDRPIQRTKKTFLDNVRIARNLLAHNVVESDSSSIGTKTISEAITRGALWLTRKAVEGFNVADFGEISANQRAKLTASVETFRQVAGEIAADKAPTREQYARGAKALVAILEILQNYLPTPEEANKVEKVLRTVSFPAWVVNWDYELGSNEAGDAAVWVNVFAEPGAVPNKFGRYALQLIPTIRTALAAEGVDRWPYFRLPTAPKYKTA